MTLGHFTSWRADDRGYYTGVERARERETEREREREREELVTFLGQIPGKVWEYTNTSVTYDMVHDTHEMIRTRKSARDEILTIFV